LIKYQAPGTAMRRAVWKFAGFEFNSARGLERGGVAVPMQAKPRGLLELLLRAKGAVVRKDTIAAALWSAEAPSDASIARAVSGLRKALAESGKDIVRTVYGEGVQLACPLEAVGGEDETDQESVTQLLRTAWEVNASRSPAGFSRALETLRYAVASFPDSAPAWALLADSTAAQSLRSQIAPSVAASQIHHYCEMALRADPQCLQALATSGWALGMLMGRSDDGLRRIDGSIQKGSGFQTFLYRAWLQADRRNLPGAIDDVERGLALSPLERALLELRAWLMFCQGKLDETDAFARDAQNIRDDVDGLWIIRSIVACERGEPARGCAYAERAAALAGRDRATLMNLAYAYAKAGDVAGARKTLDAIGPGPNGHTSSRLVAPLVALGEFAEANRILSIAKAERCPWSAFAWCDPRLKSLASEV